MGYVLSITKNPEVLRYMTITTTALAAKLARDAIEYVKQTEGLGFIDSLKFLAQKYSIDAPELEESQKHKFQKNP